MEETLVAEHWVENHKRDSWRRQAKASGYRARSAFKLKQIQERFHLVRDETSFSTWDATREDGPKWPLN